MSARPHSTLKELLFPIVHTLVQKSLLILNSMTSDLTVQEGLSGLYEFTESRYMNYDRFRDRS